MNPTAYPSGGERGLREDSRAYHGGLCLVLHNMMLAKNTPPGGKAGMSGTGPPQAGHQGERGGSRTGSSDCHCDFIVNFPEDRWSPDRSTVRPK